MIFFGKPDQTDEEFYRPIDVQGPVDQAVGVDKDADGSWSLYCQGTRCRRRYSRSSYSRDKYMPCSNHFWAVIKAGVPVAYFCYCPCDGGSYVTTLEFMDDDVRAAILAENPVATPPPGVSRSGHAAEFARLRDTWNRLNLLVRPNKLPAMPKAEGKS